MDVLEGLLKALINYMRGKFHIKEKKQCIEKCERAIEDNGYLAG